MAWLKGLAGKAEDFLNQIDQNAAIVLTMQKDKVVNDSQLTEVTWDKPIPVKPLVADILTTQIPTTIDISHSNPSTSHSSASSTLNSVRSSPSLSSFMPIRSKQKKGDDLIDFLNSSSDEKSIQENIPGIAENRRDLNTNSPLIIISRKPSPMNVDIVNEIMTLSTSSYSGTSRSSSRQESPDKELAEKMAAASVNQTLTSRVAEELRTENELLKNELRSFNNEMSLLLQRAKAAERECTSLQQQLTKLQAAKTQSCLSLKDKEDHAARLEIELKVARQELSTAMQMSRNLEAANSKLSRELANSSEYQNEEVIFSRRELADKEEELMRAKSAHKQEVISIKNSIKNFESEKASLSSQIAEVQQTMDECQKESLEWREKFDKSRVELGEVQSELDQYRTRAQRILHDKDKLIAELRGEGVGRGSPVDDVTAMELEQLRQERELLREEATQVSTRLHATRSELAEADRKLEASRELAASTNTRLQKNLLEEKSLRQAAEEDCRTQAEGLRSVREELSRQRALLASKVQDRETELTKLRLQLSQRPAPLGSELEARLHALTQTLVTKQTALETVSTERNALRLQYEKLEGKHRETLALLYHSQGGINVNDTDDAKARLPSFFDESPFDTGVARRVKRAYSNLDAVSIRTGVFLRRYPLARILMLSYMVLLHLWVMLVLFTYTPEVHPKNNNK